MASVDPPLDEVQWRSPQAVTDMQGVHSNSILFYFAQSPFFDRTSNNAVLFNQAMYNPSMMPIIQTRDAFEGRLKTMSGLEFVVAQEPAEMAPGTGTGVWVIRKQTRRKKQGDEDEITVHSSYFVVGDNVYMAPSVADVIGSRMLSMLFSLNKFLSTASALPDFSPALGHTYFSHTAKLTQTSATQLGQISKENTPLPDGLQSQSSNTKPNSSTNKSSLLASRLLEESINIYLKYGDEYMDENPITGEPGAFHLSSSGRKENLSIPTSVKGPLQTSKPTPLKTDIPLGLKDRKGEKSPRTPGTGKSKRRKSKANTGNVSPMG